MKRATMLAVVVGLILALTAGVAVAKEFRGTPGDDVLNGTDSADQMYGQAGSDRLYGRGGGDTIRGGFDDDPALRGHSGRDTIYGNLGSDRAWGDSGDDTIRMVGDAKVDFVNCGGGIDTAYVSGNDVVSGTQANALTTTALTDCETIFVDGIRVPQIDLP